MLACARIGAVHTVVFGGFSASALADRLVDARAFVVITCDGVMRGNKPINLYDIANEACKIAPEKGMPPLMVRSMIVLERLGQEARPLALSERRRGWTPWSLSWAPPLSETPEVHPLIPPLSSWPPPPRGQPICCGVESPAWGWAGARRAPSPSTLLEGQRLAGGGRRSAASDWGQRERGPRGTKSCAPRHGSGPRLTRPLALPRIVHVAHTVTDTGIRHTTCRFKLLSVDQRAVLRSVGTCCTSKHLKLKLNIVVVSNKTARLSLRIASADLRHAIMYVCMHVFM